MELKLFGKELFSIGRNSGPMKYDSAVDALEKKEHLIDFHKDTGRSNSGMLIEWSNSVGPDTSVFTQVGGAVVAVGPSSVKSKKEIKGKKSKVAKAPAPVVEKPKITPKGVYELKTLHDETFKINTDVNYINDQLDTFKEKLGMIKGSEYDMNYGTTEIASIISRFENRKKYDEFVKFYEEFPYTTSSKIADLTKQHSHLQLGQVEQFLADMPKDAVDVMKRYTEQTKRLCGKKPVFYIIADKKDFQKTQSRRDPILLAQSPFGHFWQILGAWDKEMVLTEEL